MVDIVDVSTRSRMMAGIKGRNTKPEILIRKLLHKKGFRFRLHVKDLPGKPDIVLPKYKAVNFVNGCFWHGHKDCRFFKLPATRTEFWQEKIMRNQANDSKSINLLLENNWKVAVIWECSIRGATKDPDTVIDLISEWLPSERSFIEIA
ncbi:very short patch repair endonuclease [Acinetobacter indicus]|uniref:very short patch repair endonuclease n=1 Tax=Acinetobacter indicus TaxID=756892 RepID=UPI000CEC65BD|nr:very short patch repair endonuclease [Acinetobacter indicus]